MQCIPKAADIQQLTDQYSIVTKKYPEHIKMLTPCSKNKNTPNTILLALNLPPCSASQYGQWGGGEDHLICFITKIHLGTDFLKKTCELSCFQIIESSLVMRYPLLKFIQFHLDCFLYCSLLRLQLSVFRISVLKRKKPH